MASGEVTQRAKRRAPACCVAEIKIFRSASATSSAPRGQFAPFGIEHVIAKPENHPCLPARPGRALRKKKKSSP